MGRLFGSSGPTVTLCWPSHPTVKKRAFVETSKINLFNSLVLRSQEVHIEIFNEKMSSNSIHTQLYSCCYSEQPPSG